MEENCSPLMEQSADEQRTKTSSGIKYLAWLQVRPISAFEMRFLVLWESGLVYA